MEIFNKNRFVSAILISYVLTDISAYAMEEEALALTFISTVSQKVYTMTFISDALIKEPRYEYIKKLKIHNQQPRIDD